MIKKINFKIKEGLKQFEIPTKIINKMFQLNEEGKGNTYPKPDKVVATVLTINGKLFSGISYHTEIMSLTMHAEATALAHAAIHGEKEIIAITGPNCHACKQLLWENALRFGNDIIIIFKEKDTFKQIPLSEMMLYAWPSNEWKNKTT
jgi:cytidine deaminase